jgi:xanthine dehydrogenase accessory factor
VSAVVSAGDAAYAALQAANGGRAVAVVLVVTGSHAGSRVLWYEDGVTAGSTGDGALDAAAHEVARRVLSAGGTLIEEVQVGGEGFAVFAEAHRAPERLVIVGAGHIAVPLARLGVSLGFRVTVLDDREEFATAERFDPRARVLRADFASDPFAGVEIDAHSYVALVTRGHKWDFDCLQRLVQTDRMPRYIGMIGSRRRVKAAFQALLQAGVSRDVLLRVRAPIGLDIDAETPEEIAVSIAAELVACRRGGAADSLAARERVLERLLPERGAEDGGS